MKEEQIKEIKNTFRSSIKILELNENEKKIFYQGARSLIAGLVVTHIISDEEKNELWDFVNVEIDKIFTKLL